MKKNRQKFIPRITFAALRGGSGKTIAALGVTRALTHAGKKIAVFKKGPDYIDAAWLSMASGHPCFNLDAFLMSRDAITRSFARRSASSELAIIEGNRGLFDGVDVKGAFSTSQLAVILGSPVILVMDCTKVTRTAAAMVRGCINFEEGVNIIGVILNRVAGRRHENILKGCIEEYAGVPVLGIIPRMKHDPLPMRHLGVTPAFEYDAPDKALDQLARITRDNIDLDRIMELASTAVVAPEASFPKDIPEDSAIAGSAGVKIGVIRDASFQFYYPENLEALEKAGAKLIFLNALSDASVPDIHCLYIGGGFPETHAEQLSSNRSFKVRLKARIESGLPVYAECGGLMYLGRKLLWDDKNFEMLGILEWDFVLKKRPVGHGYSVLSFFRDSPFFKRGDVIQGHEFHYSQPVATGTSTTSFSCRVERGHGFDGQFDGLCSGNVFGTYTHIHSLGNSRWGKQMVNAALAYKKSMAKLGATMISTS